MYAYLCTYVWSHIALLLSGQDVFQTAIEALSAVVLRNQDTSQLAVNVLDFVSILSEVLSSGHSPQVKLGAAEW